MSLIECPEAPIQVSDVSISQRDIADACRAIRSGWSSHERESRMTLADMKQINLLFKTMDLSRFFQKIAG